MAIEINGKVYRNLQEQVQKNMEDIDELKRDSGYTAGTGIDITNDVISVDTDVIATKSYVYTKVYDYVDKKINDLRWELGSHTLDVTTDTDTKYLKSVPSGTIGCQINKVGGMSYKSDNLINYKYINSPKFTDLGNGSFKMDWRGDYVTITLPYSSFKTNTQYSLTLTSVSGAKYWAYNMFWNYTDNTSERFTNNQGLNYGTYSYTSASNKTLASITWVINFEANFKDLMLNVGTPLPYQPYFDGIRNSAVTRVASKDSNDTTIDALTIHTIIKSLTGYGWGINNTCYNYIDFENKKFVQKVGKLTFNGGSSEDWTDRPTYNAADRFVLNWNLPIGAGGLVNWNGFNYIIATGEELPNTFPYICNNNGTQIVVNFSAKGTTTLAQFKEYLSTNNLVIYYELETPIETDISAYLTTDTIDVEPLGTLEFTNAYTQDVPSDIDYLIEEVKA